MTGMPIPQLLALSVGSFEILAGLMIALNFFARFFAILLILFRDHDHVLFSRFLESVASPDNAKTP